MLRTLASLRFNGFLAQRGWFESVRRGEPVDLLGEPLPWLTYPLIMFLEKRLTTRLDVFEFGAGNSTLYFASRVRSVTSVEHSAEWFRKLQRKVPSNVNLTPQELVEGGDYSRFALHTGKTYDILIVDGRDRVNCMLNSLAALKPDGVLILDDAERSEYSEGITFLQERGFRKLEFWGVAPGMLVGKCTAIFYRTANCLGI